MEKQLLHLSTSSEVSILYQDTEDPGLIPSFIWVHLDPHLSSLKTTTSL